jgi:TatD DNase family protein
VHSFTGTAEEMRELMDLGLYIGINGCSFKTAENCEVVKGVELSRLMIETDGPWCEVRPSHEGWKYLVEWEVKAKAAAEATAASKAAAEVAAAAAAAESAAPPKGQEGQGEGGQPGRKQRPKKQQQQQQQGKKNQKREPEVPERYKVVKKEKWEEGAMVKGRNEPCTIERIAKIVAGIKGVSVEEVCEAAWANTVKVFGVDS